MQEVNHECQNIEQCKLRPCQDWLESVQNKSSLKGLCHTRRIDEKHFEVVGPTFSNTIRRVQEAVFICLNRVNLQKVSSIFYSRTFLVLTGCLLQKFHELYAD